MRKWYVIFGILIVTVAYAAGLKIETWNELRFGTGAGDRIITFDQSPDGNSVSLSVDTATDSLTLNRPMIFSDQVTANGLLDLNANLDLTGNIIQTGNITTTGDLQITGRSSVISVSEGSIPCPKMTEAQKNAITGQVDGDCVYDTDNHKLYTYDSNAAKWVEAGGGAGGSRLQLLEDNSFESGVAEGTCTSCVAAAETTNILSTPNNAQALKMTFSGLSGNYIVDKTTSAQWANVSGRVSCWIKTTVPNVDFCSRDAGADVDCVDVVSNGEWKEYVIPTVVGTTSHGYKVDHPTTETGDIFVDECNVLASENTFEVAQGEYIGSVSYTPTANCDWPQTVGTSRVVWSADTDCPLATVVTPTGELEAPDTKIPGFKLNQRVGIYRIKLSAAIQDATADNHGLGVALYDGTNHHQSKFMFTNNTNSVHGMGAEFVIESSSSGLVSYNLSGLSSLASQSALIQNTDTKFGFRYDIFYTPPKGKIFSQLGETTLVTASGNSDEVLAANQALPFIEDEDQLNEWNGTEYTASKDVYLDITGNARFTAAAAHNIYAWIDTGGGYVRDIFLGTVASTSNATQKFTGKIKLNRGDKLIVASTLAGTVSNVPDLHYIDIKEIPNYNQIVGKFKEVPTIKGTNKAGMISFCRAGGTGAITASVGDNPISGSCTVATPSVCTFASPFSQSPICNADSFTSGRRECNVESTTSTTVSVRCFNGADADTTTSTTACVQCWGELP